MRFDAQPVLIGRSVRLRPLRVEDHDELYEVARDRLIWEQHPNADRHRAEQFDVYFDDAIRSRGALAITDANGALIGATRFHGHDPAARVVEIGWTFLARSYWGDGTNAEVKQLMLEHAFASVDRVVFLIGPQNYRSQRAVEKLGARLTGEKCDGAGQTSLLYELHRPNPSPGRDQHA